MKRHALFAIAGLVLLAIAGMLWFRGGCTPETCGPLVGMELRELIARQAVHGAQHGAFASSLEELGLRPAPRVHIELLYADSAGWIARGTHDELEGRSCVAWMGSVPQRPVTAHGTTANEPSRIYCDFPT